MKGQKVLMSRKSDEWRTPTYIWKFIKKKYHPNIDGASNERNKLCKKNFTKTKSFLKEYNTYRLRNKIIYINPPFSKLKEFVRKAVYLSLNQECTIIMLIPARVDTLIWHDEIFKFADKIYFIKGRLTYKLHGKKTAPSTFPSAIIVFGGKNNKSIYSQGIYPLEILK